MEHPVERRKGRLHERFAHTARRASYFASSGTFFVFCVALVVAWLMGYLVGASGDYETALGIAMTAVTLLLVALLRNSELRAERAIQEKLDALAIAMRAELRSEHGEAALALDRAIGLEDEI